MVDWNLECKPDESSPPYAALCQATVMATEMKAGHGVKQHSQQMGIELRELLDTKFPITVGRRLGDRDLSGAQVGRVGRTWTFM